MALCREIYYYITLFYYLIYKISVADIAFYKPVTPVFLYIPKVFTTSAIGKLVQIRNLIGRMPF